MDLSRPANPEATTGQAISSDSGEHWAAEGAWPVAEGIHRIPLPLPSDGLRAVNVYAIEGPTGLTLVDGGWAIPQGRDRLEASLASIGFRLADIRRFLVTHAHRDHYTLAAVLAAEYGAAVSLGATERAALDVMQEPGEGVETFARLLVVAGAPRLAQQWRTMFGDTAPDPRLWTYPDTWLRDDEQIDLGSRALQAVHTPGHTQGHFVFADRAEGLLFAGDHVLPTITPSIGFEPVPGALPLGDFIGSLTKVRTLPDLRLLPAHGPVAASSHARIDELLAHHDQRLQLCLEALSGGSATAFEVAGAVPWTRHRHAFASLDVFNASLASMETKAHLDLLVARGRVTRADIDDVTVYEVAA